MEHPLGKQESLENHRARRVALMNAMASMGGSDSDAVIQRQLAVIAYSMRRDERPGGVGAEKGSHS